jgi:alpha-L-fucosidase
VNQFSDSRAWFHEKRFGMFIHFGLYAVRGWHEQEIWRWPVGRADYARYAETFNPVAFDADQWLDAAESVGMQYMVFTTKHCDGFCNWDTKQTEFKITRTPFKRDLLRELSEACQRRNFPLCLYYSIPDLHHPSYPHAGRPYERAQPEPGDTADFEKYLAYVRAQMVELLTEYGTIHGWWWDGNVMQHQDTQLNNLIRELQPAAVINPRGFDKGDYRSPERDWDEGVNTDLAFAEPTEACQSLGLYSWGWKQDEDYYSLMHLKHSIAKIMAKGGNYLLNIGPRADGSICENNLETLRRLGQWYANVRTALVGTEPCTQLSENRSLLLTRCGQYLYVILHKPPTTNAIRLKPIHAIPQEVVLLNTGRTLDWVINRVPGYGPRVGAEPFLRIRNIPVDELAGDVVVIRIQLNPSDLAGIIAAQKPCDGEREYAAAAYK